MSSQRAVVALIALALLAGILPVGFALDRWLTRELQARVREELARAPRLLEDRTAMIQDAFMMHAKDLANAPGLADALSDRDRARALRIIEEAGVFLKEEPVLLAQGGELWTGPRPPESLVEATRRGDMPVQLVSDGGMLGMLSLAPVELAGSWVGAAGVAAPWDEGMAATLAGLTHSEVILSGGSGSFVATDAIASVAPALLAAVAARPADGRVYDLTLPGQSYLVSHVSLGDATAVFVRDMQRELAVLPKLRMIIAASGVAALVLALVLGSLLATIFARPIRALATAADRVAEGDFAAPLPTSSLLEVRRVTQAFEAMRRVLAARLEDLRAANRGLEERQVRLATLQSELLQRERAAVSARLVAELAHEIRNPVANLRNCLELLHRRLEDDPEGREFADLAINELLRMHELAERMLDLNRPRDQSLAHCDPARVAREVAGLMRAGVDAGQLSLHIREQGDAEAAIPPDALKQVLLNLVQNARDARPHGLVVEVRIWREGSWVYLSVCDNGPGIPPGIRERIFDPFVTSKRTAGGIGLGLFLAEGIVRTYGGKISVSSEPTEDGACFRVELPATDSPPHDSTLTEDASS